MIPEVSTLILSTTPMICQQAPAVLPAQARAAQVGDPDHQPVPIDPETGRPVIEPRPPVATETAEEAAARMFLGGGSLLRAQVSVQEDLSIYGPSHIDTRVSFFAVPEPEPTIIRKHDLVTVIVREESSAKSQGKTDTSKEFEIDAQLRNYLGVDLSEFSLESKTADERISAEAERSFSGDGTVDRKDSFTARVTAEVLDVKPNGTVVLQARKRITNDDEEQTFILTGTCRTLDITADNTVLSTQLHDLDLKKQTRGAIRDATRRGFIPRLIDRINPF